MQSENTLRVHSEERGSVRAGYNTAYIRAGACALRKTALKLAFEILISGPLAARNYFCSSTPRPEMLYGHARRGERSETRLYPAAYNRQIGCVTFYCSYNVFSHIYSRMFMRAHRHSYARWD